MPNAPQDAAATAQTDTHKNEGFLKSAWHKLTHQHGDGTSTVKGGEDGEASSQADEPKKAAGSA